MSKSQNVYQRLATVANSIEVIEKDAQVKFGTTKYDYVSSSAVVHAIKGLIAENGLLLIPEIINQEITHLSNGYFTRLEMKMTWINTDNPEEKVVCSWAGQGVDNSEKGIGKALTYACKYFLLKFFNIPTDKDDPDYHENKQEKKPQYASTSNKPPIAPEKEKIDIKGITTFFDNCKTGEEVKKVWDNLSKEAQDNKTVIGLKNLAWKKLKT